MNHHNTDYELGLADRLSGSHEPKYPLNFNYMNGWNWNTIKPGLAPIIDRLQKQIHCFQQEYTGNEDGNWDGEIDLLLSCVAEIQNLKMERDKAEKFSVEMKDQRDVAEQKLYDLHVIVDIQRDALRSAKCSFDRHFMILDNGVKVQNITPFDDIFRAIKQCDDALLHDAYHISPNPPPIHEHAPELLIACMKMIEWLDKHPPMGESLYFIKEIRECAEKCIHGVSTKNESFS